MNVSAGSAETLKILEGFLRSFVYDFKGGEFKTFKAQAGLNSFHLTPRANV